MDDKEKRGETAEGGADATAPTQGSGALIEPPEEAVGRLEGEVADLKDKYLRLAAEYDNFRQRALKERTEAWEKGQADFLLPRGGGRGGLARFAPAGPGPTHAPESPGRGAPGGA